MTKPDHISHSQMQTARCLLRYKLTRLTKDIDPDTVPMRAGSFAHEVVYRMTKECVEQGQDPDIQQVNALIDECFEKWKLPEEEYIGLRSALLEFAEKGFDRRNVADVEQRFRQDIDGVIVEGVIDRVNSYKSEDGRVLEIVDYKTQQNIVTNEAVKRSPQLNLYRWIATQWLYPNFDLVRTGIYHIRWNCIRWSGEPTPIGDYAKDDEAIERMVRRQWKRISEAEDYPPEKGPQCHELGGCPVLLAGKCPTWSKEKVAEMAAGSLEDQVRAARAMKLELAELTKRVSGQLKDRDPIDVDGNEAGYKKSVSFSYRMPELHSWCSDNGVPMAGVMVSGKQTQAAVKMRTKGGDEVDGEGLAKLAVEKATTRFSL